MGLNWNPSANYCAEMTHLLGAICIMQASQGQHLSMVWTALILLAAAAVKEFWADRGWLESDSMAGSALDFSMYAWGAVLGWLSYDFFWLSLCLAAATILTMVSIDVLAPRLWPK